MSDFMSYNEIIKKIENTGILAIEWSIEDVKHQCPLLDDNESKEVLKYMYDKDDANHGINWEFIDYSIRECFPEKWAKYIEEMGSNLTGRCRSVQESFYND